MQNKYGKLFKNFKAEGFKFFPYDLNQGYQKLVQEALEKGYQEVNPLTMIYLADYLVAKKGCVLTEIEYPLKDLDSEIELTRLIEKYKRGEMEWWVFEATIAKYLNISKISFRGDDFLFTVQKNGVIVVSENAYELVTNMICDGLNKGL